MSITALALGTRAESDRAEQAATVEPFDQYGASAAGGRNLG